VLKAQKQTHLEASRSIVELMKQSQLVDENRGLLQRVGGTWQVVARAPGTPTRMASGQRAIRSTSRVRGEENRKNKPTSKR
jgi:hypothetical protein